MEILFFLVQRIDLLFFIWLYMVKQEEKNERKNQVDLFQVERITFAFLFLSFSSDSKREYACVCVYVSERKGNEEKHFLLILLLFFIGLFFLSDSIIDQRSPIHSPSVIHHISLHILSRFIYTYIYRKWSAPLTHTLKSSLEARVHYMSNDDRFNDIHTKINIFCTFDDFIKRKEIYIYFFQMSVLFSIESLMSLMLFFSLCSMISILQDSIHLTICLKKEDEFTDSLTWCFIWLGWDQHSISICMSNWFSKFLFLLCLVDTHDSNL